MLNSFFILTIKFVFSRFTYNKNARVVTQLSAKRLINSGKAHIC